MSCRSVTFSTGEKAMSIRFLLSVAALSLLALHGGSGRADAEVLIINNGSTLTVNGSVLDVNCLDLLVKGGGSLLLEGGTIMDKRALIVEPGGIFVNNSGTILSCGAGDPFYVIPTSTGKAVVITLPEN